LENEIFTSKGFGLDEAMSSIEIGDPRMLIGFEDDLDVSFNPLKRLLPEDVFWILSCGLARQLSRII